MRRGLALGSMDHAKGRVSGGRFARWSVNVRCKPETCFPTARTLLRESLCVRALCRLAWPRKRLEIVILTLFAKSGYAEFALWDIAEQRWRRARNSGKQ